MIRVEGMTKRFGSKTAVDQLSFDVRPGVVTGFLGPNGSGKSTTMRCMLDLDRADSGTATFDGRRFRDLHRPLHEVAALLDAGYVHPGRSGRNPSCRCSFPSSCFYVWDYRKIFLSIWRNYVSCSFAVIA